MYSAYLFTHLHFPPDCYHFRLSAHKRSTCSAPRRNSGDLCSPSLIARDVPIVRETLCACCLLSMRKLNLIGLILISPRASESFFNCETWNGEKVELKIAWESDSSSPWCNSVAMGVKTQHVRCGGGGGGVKSAPCVNVFLSQPLLPPNPPFTARAHVLIGRAATHV